MKTFNFLLIISVILFSTSCEKDEVRYELPGSPTSISGNVKDYHRSLNVNNFEIKLLKVWHCGSGPSPNYCTKEIATTYSDAEGNYQLNFDYNLRNDETYRIAFNETENNNHYVEFVSSTGEFYRDYDVSNLIVGQNNIIDINAWIPVKIKFNLTVFNNHTAPLVTGIEYNNHLDFGTELIYDSFKTFEIRTRPNSEVNIKFWYIENYNSSNPIFHYAPIIPYATDETEVTEVNYEIDCNEF
ncbi:hypothetical protein [Flavobacterium caeni]|uniref:Uncharacterized protein n=1 Tax=Flavobacterium caeni TaxID=490189 RepID=A0A1G5KM34_9FLAO|nr:hypothetical protein [Flavobacterium caeni]SCZ01642.1 hypothetical protein SAMN02927903_03380 [Flavobacterium caeni]